jgi:hypothetical protein
MSTRYEYKIQLQSYDPNVGIDQDIHTLNLLGDEGWESVSVAGPQKTPSHGLAWHDCFRRVLVNGTPNPILQETREAIGLH